MIDGVEVAQNAERAKARPHKQQRQVAGLPAEAAARAQQDNRRKQDGNRVAEEAFLDGGQVAGQPHEGVHQCEAEGRAQDQYDGAGLLVFHVTFTSF